jgi:hypothetical protein
LPTQTGADLSVTGPCTVGGVQGSIYKFGTVTIQPGGALQFQPAESGQIDFTATSIAVNGALTFAEAPNSKTKVKATSIVVENGGSVSAGTAADPFGEAGGQLTITFVGSPVAKCPDIEPGTDWCGKGILVKPGATLKLYGAKGVFDSGVSWTHLSAPSGPTTGDYVDGAKVASIGSQKLYLAKDVVAGKGAWKKGDWIAVATTSFSPFETEFVQLAADPTLTTQTISGVSVQVSEVTLSQALKYYHFGGLDPGPPGAENYKGAKSGAAYNYGVDERAEVGLISRSIKLTADIDPAAPHWGGETKFMHMFKEVVLQGVELEKFGKARLGSYPIHLHVLGNVATPLTVNANSVHHSFNKCVTVHSTTTAIIENNVCARIIGHIFYQEVGNEEGITFRNNLGLGAMSHYFDIHNTPNGLKREDLIAKYWWIGDNLVKLPGYNYDGFNVPNGDAQKNPTRGGCFAVNQSGDLAFKYQPFNPLDESKKDVSCEKEGLYYVESASGFWIINPATTLIGNSIGGCQGVGRAFWFVPPQDAQATQALHPDLANLKFRPVGTFRNNRAHGCYAGLYGEPENDVVFSSQLLPRASDPFKLAKFGFFDSFTATRNRDRGVWLRPAWFTVTNARLATNRHNISLVTSGGLDGNQPGVWGLLADSVMLGLSQNNVDRFGPCPQGNPADGRPSAGCIDLTQIKAGDPLKGGEVNSRGYPDPDWNIFGFMIYDGPVRIFNNRFVNFLVDVKPHLTKADKAALETWNNKTGRFKPFTYEGDAALGWFNSNQSAYPVATSSSNLIFENVTLRHQVYTDKVNPADFADGDKNTAILDRDGSLGGYHVVNAGGQTVHEAFPISLNNLPFNATGNSVAECLALGGLDNVAEKGRPTALMSPSSTGTLEFGALYPYPPELDNSTVGACDAQHWQIMEFSKDSVDFGAHQTMQLFSRDGKGIWEPKVASGHGYTVKAKPGKSKAANPPSFCQPVGTLAGIPNVIDIGVADVVKPEISKDNPFWIRLGICYQNKDKTFPAGQFTIKRGYKSYGGSGVDPNQIPLRKFWNELNFRYKSQVCAQLDAQQYVADGAHFKSRNLDPATGCPADGVMPRLDANGNPLDVMQTEANKDSGFCPAGSVKEPDQQNRLACIFKKDDLDFTAANNISELMVGDKPVLNKYFYDATKGLLFLNVAQEFPNPIGPSPLGDCPGNPACPNTAVGESYYACPAQGCLVYIIRQNDPNYQPGEGFCEPYTGSPNYAQPRPVGEFKLVYKDTSKAVVATATGDPAFPFYAPSEEPSCPVTTPASDEN